MGRGDVSLNYGAKLLLMTYPILLNLTGASLVTEFIPCFGQVNRVFIISVKANLLLKGYHDNINYSKEKTILDVLALPDPVYFFQFLNIHINSRRCISIGGVKNILKQKVKYMTKHYCFSFSFLIYKLVYPFNLTTFVLKMNKKADRDIRGSV